MVKAARLAIKRSTQGEHGAEVDTCPWRAFYDPEVAEVLAAYAWFESGQVATAIGNDPPHVLLEAIRFFHDAQSAAHSREIKAQREKSGRR